MTVVTSSGLPATDQRLLGRSVALWGFIGAGASVAVLPYAAALHPNLFAHIPVPLPVFFLAQFVQALVILSLLVWSGLRLTQSVRMTLPILPSFLGTAPGSAWPMKTLGSAALAGGITGATLIVLDKAFAPFMPGTMQVALPEIALWKRFLACFYGGITEELICRLFLMTLLVWLCRRFASPKDASATSRMYWAGVIGAALLFGLGHLPAAAALWPLTTLVVARVLIMNCIGGIVFGWLYWRRGLEHAVVAHFSADLVLHVIGGA